MTRGFEVGEEDRAPLLWPAPSSLSCRCVRACVCACVHGRGCGLERAWRRGVAACVLLVAATFTVFVVSSPTPAGIYTRVMFTFNRAPEYIMDFMVPSLNASGSSSSSSLSSQDMEEEERQSRDEEREGGMSNDSHKEKNSLEKGQNGFLVHTPGCIIPDFDPFHPSITRFISNSSQMTCKGPPSVTSSKGTTLYFHQHILIQHHQQFLNISREKRRQREQQEAAKRLKAEQEAAKKLKSTARKSTTHPPTSTKASSTTSSTSTHHPSIQSSTPAFVGGEVEVYVDLTANNNNSKVNDINSNKNNTSKKGKNTDKSNKNNKNTKNRKKRSSKKIDKRSVIVSTNNKDNNNNDKNNSSNNKDNKSKDSNSSSKNNSDNNSSKTNNHNNNHNLSISDDGEVWCCYKAIYRFEHDPKHPNAHLDNRWRFSTWCQNLTETEYSIEDEAVLVVCELNGIPVYKNVHYFIQRDKILERLESLRNSSTGENPSLNISVPASESSVSSSRSRKKVKRSLDSFSSSVKGIPVPFGSIPGVSRESKRAIDRDKEEKDQLKGSRKKQRQKRDAGLSDVTKINPNTLASRDSEGSKDNGTEKIDRGERVEMKQRQKQAIGSSETPGLVVYRDSNKEEEEVTAEKGERVEENETRVEIEEVKVEKGGGVEVRVEEEEVRVEKGGGVEEVRVEEEEVRVEKGGGVEEVRVEEVILEEEVKEEEEQEARVEEPKQRHKRAFRTAEKLSVIIFGTDSASRLNMHRHLSNTFKYLTEELGAVEVLGYNKVGDNTFPNLMPLLSGLTAREIYEHPCNPKKKHFDNCPLIFHDFSKNGYVTVFAEDAPWMGVFNYVNSGFHYQPTHFYGRPFFMASEKEIANTKKGNANVCQGTQLSIEVIHGISLQVARTFPDHPTFGLYWSASLSHDYLNYLRHTDLPHLHYLRELQESGALNHTALLFMSDHGMRWGSIRSTYVGMLEERLPYVLLYLPPWFRTKYQAAFTNLRLNAHRLTANYDLYQTLLDLAYGRFADLAHVKGKPGPGVRGISLFQRVPKSRTCEDANIPEHYCTCQDTQEITLDDPLLRQAATALLNTLNDDLLPYQDCVQFAEVEVLTARVSRPKEKLAKKDSSSAVRSYLIQVELSPGGVGVEGTLRYTYPGDFQVTGELSRITEYGNTSHCIHHSVLRKFCFCKDMLKYLPPRHNKTQTETQTQIEEGKIEVEKKKKIREMKENESDKKKNEAEKKNESQKKNEKNKTTKKKNDDKNTMEKKNKEKEKKNEEKQVEKKIKNEKKKKNEEKQVKKKKIEEKTQKKKKEKQTDKERKEEVKSKIEMNEKEKQN